MMDIILSSIDSSRAWEEEWRASYYETNCNSLIARFPKRIDGGGLNKEKEKKSGARTIVNLNYSIDVLLLCYNK